MRRGASQLADATKPGSRTPSLKTSALFGMTVAVEIAIGELSRMVRGIIVRVEQGDHDTLHVAVEDQDGTGGSPILVVPQPGLQPGDRFGCDYFLRLSDEDD